MAAHTRRSTTKGQARKAPKKPLNKRRGDGDGFRGDHLQAIQRQFWEPAELQAFFSALKGDPFWEPYFSIQYFWGCRVSEPALLDVDDVSLERGKIVITRLKKDARNEKTPEGIFEDVKNIPASLVPHIETALQCRIDRKQEKSAWLFPSRVRRAWKPDLVERMAHLRRNADNLLDSAVSRQTATRWFHVYAEKADIPNTKNLRRTHILRHTRATLLFAEGATSDYVKRHLGHSSLLTTEKYIHAAEGLRRRYEDEGTAMLGLGGLFGTGDGDD